ncbi:hypothetical protein PENSTE_c015G06641 [Penicillium steckii]|uniref:(S)-ureidoglycine aminohydrolase cupin domain-containing protein n=1 Tax=Penicillium steckii TaxID=303698 RepID=A0A1V6SZK9_9EURO|nr:hypothetical protein PENSTE_c015G06641 [Penicillium steckii]
MTHHGKSSDPTQTTTQSGSEGTKNQRIAQANERERNVSPFLRFGPSREEIHHEWRNGSRIKVIIWFTMVSLLGWFLGQGISKVMVSGSIVPITVIKGAGHEFIPLPESLNATTADFHSIRTETESPAHITSGFYKIEAGPARDAHYTFEETKYVLSGQIDVLDEATGITHHLVAGDFAFFHVGAKVQFSTMSSGFAFYAVTRAMRTPHPNLQGREEGASRQ